MSGWRRVITRVAFTLGGGGSVAVLSVFGRIGNVVAVLGDYAASLVTNDSSVVGTTVKDALNTLGTAVASPPVTSVFGRLGAVVATLNDYAASLVQNDSSVVGATVTDALNTLLAAHPVGTVEGQELFFDGSTWQEFGVKTGNLTDTDQTVNYGTNPAWYWAGTQAANRSKTVGITGAFIGAVVRFYLRDPGATTTAIVNGGTNGGVIFTKPVSTKLVVDVRYDGVDWILGGVQTLSN